MPLTRRDTPVGLDKVLDEIQVLIYNYLTTNSCVKGDYSNYASYNRVYKNVYQSPSKTGIFAEQFLTGIDYKSVFTNDNFSVSSFIIANDNEKKHTKTRKIRTISVIFQINLKKVYATVPHRADEEFHNELSNALRGLKKPHELIDGINGIDNVYTEFEIARLKEKNHDLHPLHVFRQDIEVQYDYDCCPTFATKDCTIGVTVDAQPETSLGAGDGTATAEVTGPQGNIAYLWDDPLEQTTQIATGLVPATYRVIVTDDNVLIPACTATASGTVTIPPPLPECNLIIDEITSTPPTTFGGSDGTATVTFLNNVGAVAVKWDESAASQTTTTAFNLSAGKVCVSITDLDVKGCTQLGSTILADGVRTEIDPEDLINLVFNPDAGVESSFNGGSISDTDPISEILPVSPATEDVLQDLIADQVIWRSDGMGTNDLPRMNFIASSGHQLKSVYSHSGSFSAMFVIKIGAVGNDRTLFSSIGNVNFYLNVISATEVTLNFQSTEIVSMSTSLNVGDSAIVSVRYNTTTSTAYLKVNDGSEVSGVVTDKTLFSLVFGSRANNANQRNFDGDMGQMPFYSDFKTEAEFDLLAAGFNTKFGIF